MNSAYTFTFDLTGAPTPSTTLTAGALPPGLTLSEDGVISGTPTATGVFIVTATATNDVGSANHTTSIIINAATQAP